MKKEELLGMISKGILAPSGDNMQPWRFRLAEGAVELLIQPAHSEHFFEAGYRTLYLSAGMGEEMSRMQVTTPEEVALYLRKTKIFKDGEGRIYWSLVESIRTAKGPRQRTAACSELAAQDLSPKTHQPNQKCSDNFTGLVVATPMLTTNSLWELRKLG